MNKPIRMTAEQLLCEHSFCYRGRVPCTGEYKCTKCNLVDFDGHWGWKKWSNARELLERIEILPETPNEKFKREIGERTKWGMKSVRAIRPFWRGLIPKGGSSG